MNRRISCAPDETCPPPPFSPNHLIVSPSTTFCNEFFTLSIAPTTSTLVRFLGLMSPPAILVGFFPPCYNFPFPFHGIVHMIATDQFTPPFPLYVITKPNSPLHNLVYELFFLHSFFFFHPRWFFRIAFHLLFELKTSPDSVNTFSALLTPRLLFPLPLPRLLVG